MDIVLGIFFVMPKALLFEHFRRCYEINFSCVWTNNNLLHNFIYIQAHGFFFRCVSHDISKGILSKILNIKWFITDHHFLLFLACITSCRVALKPIGPIASNWAPMLELSTLGCSSTHNNTLQVLQRTPMDTEPLKDPDQLVKFL